MLLEILRNSEESTSTRVSFFNKVAGQPVSLLKRETLVQGAGVFSCKFCKISSNILFFTEEEEEEEEAEEEEEEEKENIYFSKQKHSVQSVVFLNSIMSNNKKYYITVLKNVLQIQ